MKKKIKILLIPVILFVVIFAALSILASLHGKKFVENKLDNAFGAESSIESISLSIPFTINVKGLKIGRLLQADRISFSPSILSLFAGKVVLSRLTLINPVFNLELSEQGKLNLPKKDSGLTKAKKGAGAPFYLTALNITNGRVIFTDKKITPQGYEAVLSGINVAVSKQAFPPTSLNTKFRIEADIVTPQDIPLGSILFDGWVDFGPKDMDAILQVKELELTYFAPYYGNFISDKKISSARLTAVSSFKAQNNGLTIATDLKLHNLVYAEEAFQKPQSASVFGLAQKTLDLFLDPDGNLNLQFILNTKLDKPRITIAELKAAVLNAAIRSLGGQSPAELFRKGKELYEQFKDFGKEIEVSF